MKVTHSDVSYDCYVAVKCTNDNYIKLYDENGVEIAAFHHITDFSEYTISGGSFVDPCDCTAPIPLTAYSLGARTIKSGDWKKSGSKYIYEITSNLISGNVNTCNIMLLFKSGTDLAYEASQDSGKVTLYVDAAPASDIVIEGIQITRV